MGKTLLISLDKDQYFFPYINTQKVIRVNPKISSSRIFNILRKIIIKFKLPFYRFILGDWVCLVPTVDQIIIMDSGYVPGIKQYFEKISEKCNVNLFLWNHMNNYTDIQIKDFNDKSKTWTFVEEDSSKHGIKFNTTFYSKDVTIENNVIEHELLFVGREKGKAKEIISIARELQGLRIRSKIHLIKGDVEYPEEIDRYLTDEFIEYKEYLKLVSKSSMLLDYGEPNNYGLSMRVLESLFLKKKLITNNLKIIDQPFYKEQNIFLIDESRDRPLEGIELFLESEYQEIDEEQLDYYSIEQWIARFK